MLLGYPDQALQRIQQALTLAQELAHPFMLAYALNSLADVYLLRREATVTQECSGMLMALAREQGFPYWAATGTIRWGWALAEQGQAEEGIAQMRHGMAAFRSLGSSPAPQFLAWLAKAYGRIGQGEEGPEHIGRDVGSDTPTWRASGLRSRVVSAERGTHSSV